MVQFACIEGVGLAIGQCEDDCSNVFLLLAVEYIDESDVHTIVFSLRNSIAGFLSAQSPVRE